MLGEEGNGEQVNATLEYAWLETWGEKIVYQFKYLQLFPYKSRLVINWSRKIHG